VREYVAEATLRASEMFVPLSHRPGHAQADFGEADGYIAGKKVRFHYFCMDLPHSDGCFVKAYPAETAEAFATAMSRPSPSLAACAIDSRKAIFLVSAAWNARIYPACCWSDRAPGLWESAASRLITTSASKALSYSRLGRCGPCRRAINFREALGLAQVRNDHAAT
jgi:hypothetical protein